MIAQDLQNHFTTMIRTDSRPLDRRDTFQKRNAGVKATNIESVRVFAAPATGAAPPTIKQILQTSVANAGNMVQGVFMPGPMDPAAINQWGLSDCYLLVAILLIIFKQPNFFDDIIVPIGGGQLVVQFYLNHLIIQIKTSLLISTDYDRPGNGDIRPEVLEKCYGLFRSGLSDFLQDNSGLIGSALASFGLDASYPPTFSAASIEQFMKEGLVVGIGTTTTAPSPWVQDHSYAVRSFDDAGNLILRNPWAGAVDLAPTPPATIINPQIFNAIHVGSFPAQKRLLASYVPGALSAAVAAQQGKPMINVSATQPTVIPVAAATLYHDQLETQGGRQDVGFLSSDGWIEETLNAATAGTFALAIPVAAISAGSIVVSLNGSVIATVPYSATGSWATFAIISVPLSVPAGSSTFHAAPAAGAQYNLADMTLAPIAAPKQIKSLAIDFAAHSATATYNDGSTAVLN